MKIGFAALALFGAVSSVQASTIDLLLRVDSIGFTDFEIYDEDELTSTKYGFLDVNEDIWGIYRPFDRFTTGKIVSLTATLDDNDRLSSCSLGGFSCLGAVGMIGETSFNISDAVGLTSWGDFMLSGGSSIGDAVQLDTFEGAPGFVDVGGSETAFWNTFAHRFTVVSNGAYPEPAVSSLTVMPVPAAMPLLLVSLGIFGLASRSKRRLI